MIRKLIYSMPLKKKLYVIFGIIITATVAGIAVGTTSFSRVQVGGANYEAIEQNMLIADNVAKLRANLAFVRTALLTMIIDDDQARREQLRSDIDDLSERIDELFSMIEDQLKTSGQPAAINASIVTARRAWIDFQESRDKELIPAVLAGRIQEATALARGVQAVRYDIFSTETKKVVDHVREDVPVMVGKMKRESSIVKALFFLGGIIFVAFYFAVAVFFSRTLVTPIVMVSDRSSEMAGGDFAHAGMQANGKDEIGAMIVNFSSMAGKVGDTAERIKTSIISLSSSSEELSTTAEELSKGAAEQISQAREVTAATDQMSQTIGLVAQNAAQAAEAAKNSSDAATGGKEIVEMTAERLSSIMESVKETSRTIEALSKSSNEIGEILNLIHAIADQTNLLALNAAIEAARAGEQGRGFAVVADEVRKLADRTSHATKDIEQKISAIQAEAAQSLNAIKKGNTEVEKGLGLARSASQSLDTIVKDSNEVMDMVQRIAAATEEQSATAGEITRNMNAISEVVERSSAATDQVKQSAQALAELALETQAMMAWFKTDNGRPRHARTEVKA